MLIILFSQVHIEVLRTYLYVGGVQKLPWSYIQRHLVSLYFKSVSSHENECAHTHTQTHTVGKEEGVAL